MLLVRLGSEIRYEQSKCQHGGTPKHLGDPAYSIRNEDKKLQDSTRSVIEHLLVKFSNYHFILGGILMYSTLWLCEPLHRRVCLSCDSLSK